MITPAQNFLNKNHIPYQTYEYECSAQHDFGRFAASALQQDERRVFKTILLEHCDHGRKTYITCVVPVTGLISMKNTARLLQLKEVAVTDPNTAMRVTGYVIGGISPFGQKRRTLTVLDESALAFAEILVSGGRRGLSIGINPQDLVTALKAVTGDLMEHKAP